MPIIFPVHENNEEESVVIWADSGAEVAKHEVGWLYREAEECLMRGSWFQLASLVVNYADLIFSGVREKDLEFIYAVICILVTKSERQEEILLIAKRISGAVAQQLSDKPALGLKILFNLYNLLEDGYIRYHVYLKALQLALSGGVTDLVIPSFKKVDEFLKEWNVGVQEQRELFITILNILKESRRNGEDADALSEAKDAAVQAIAEFVKAPDMIQRKRKQVFQRRIRIAKVRRRNLTKPKPSPLTRQPMPEEAILPSPHRAAKKVKIRPSFRDLKSDMTVYALYFRWCLHYNIPMTSIREDEDEAYRRFCIFKKNAFQVFQMNQMDPSRQFHLRSFCDEKDLFVLKEFNHLRLGLCEKKKGCCVANLKIDVKKLENQIKFIIAIRDKDLLQFEKLDELVSELLQKGFARIPQRSTKEFRAGTEMQTVVDLMPSWNKYCYEYLLSMPLCSMTDQKVQELSAARDKTKQELEEMEAMDPMSLWEKDQTELFGALCP